VVSDQIQENGALPHDCVPLFKRIFKGLNPFVYSVLKVAAELVPLFFALVVELNCEIVQLFFHIPRNLFGRNFLDIFEAEEIKGKNLMCRFGIFVLGLKLFEEAFIGINLIKMFMILKRGFSNSEQLASKRADTGIINGLSLVGVTVPKILKVDKLNILILFIHLIVIFILFLFPDDIINPILVLNVAMNESQPSVDLIHLGVSIICYDLFVLCASVV
jgi:hypothetical protein